MASVLDNLTNGEAMKFIDQVNEPFKGVPHLPKGIVEFFVQIAPWLALIGGILGLIGGPFIGLVGTLGSVLTLSPMLMISMIVTAVITLANAILMLLAFGPLKNRELKGWVLLFWSNILGIVEAVLGLVSGGYGSLVGSIIGVLIGFYILFEMRSFYGAGQAAVKKVKEATE